MFDLFLYLHYTVIYLKICSYVQQNGIYTIGTWIYIHILCKHSFIHTQKHFNELHMVTMPWEQGTEAGMNERKKERKRNKERWIDFYWIERLSSTKHYTFLCHSLEVLWTTYYSLISPILQKKSILTQIKI